MRSKLRVGKEAWGLAALFILFLAFAAYYETAGQERTSPDAPGVNNAKARGTKALYLLLKAENFSVDELKTTWNGLGPEDRMLIVIEPLVTSRPISPHEVNVLRRWVAEGGTLLFLVTRPKRDYDPRDSLMGDIAVVEGGDKSHLVRPLVANSPYLRGVKQIESASPVRLEFKPKNRYQKLFADADGALALHKAVGKGHVLVVADSIAASNADIRKADNAVFLVNIAAEAVGSGQGVIQFDEYHHGVGFEVAADAPEEGVWQALPLSLRLVVWQALALGLLLVWNGNRYFGRPRSLPQETYRPMTDYVGSMARLYRRADAADLALMTLYRVFLRDLARQVDAPADANYVQISHLAERKYRFQDASLRHTLTRCEQVEAGLRISPIEALTLTQQLEEFRRRFDLVGN